MGRLGLLLVALAGLAINGSGQDLDRIRQLHASLSTCAGDDCRAISDSLASALSAHLAEQAEWPADGGTADFMATVQSADGRLRVITWNWPHEDRTSSYGGLVAFRQAPGAPAEFTTLRDRSSADRPDVNRSLKAEEWSGALYYAMVPDAVDDNVWLLLGWDDADAQVTRKVIEPIHIRPKGPRFGAGSCKRRWASSGGTCSNTRMPCRPPCGSSRRCAARMAIRPACSLTTWPRGSRT